MIEGSSVSPLKKDSSNIVELIHKEYNKIRSSIVLKDNSSNNFRLTYRSACFDDEIQETDRCFDLALGAQVEFEIELELLNCPFMMNEKEKKREIIRISPVGLNLQEGLLVNVEMACNCDCEKLTNHIYDETHCSNGSGYLICGLCDCLPQFYGKLCECKFDDETTELANLNDNRLNKGCYKTINDTKVCSGNGQCSCNTCFCDSPYTGKHCECDPFSCERFNNEVCSGHEHGFCNCGKCECDPRWIGNACQCLKSNETCFDPFNDKLCNDSGDCVCGRCQCYQDDDRLFSGKFCQKCSNCIDHFCAAFNEIVNKQIIDKLGEIKSENFSSFLIDNFSLIENLSLNDLNDDLETCEFLGNNSCVYTYKYRQNKDGLLILFALKHGQCKAELDIKKATTSIVVGTLITGIIALIIYKLITYCYDKKEFRRFENQIKNLNWESKVCFYHLSKCND